MKNERKQKIIKKCLTCGKNFEVLNARRHFKYCNKICGYKALSDSKKKNNPGGFKKRLPLKNLVEKEYNTLHHWINRNFEKSDKCEYCGKDGLSGKFINWANKNGKYTKERENWIRLCRKCHYWYDIQQLQDVSNG